MFLSSIVYGLGAMFGWGILNFLLSRLSQKYETLKVGVLLQILGFLPLLFLFPFIKSGQFRFDLFLSISIVGFCNALGFFSFITGFKKGAVVVITPIASAWSVITSVLSFIFLKEEVTLQKAMGIILTVLGILLVSTNFRSLFEEKKMKLIAGTKWALLTALLWGVGFFLLALFSKSLGWYYAALSFRFWVALAFICLSALFKKDIAGIFKNIQGIVILAVVFDVFGTLMFNIGVIEGEPSIVSVLGGSSAVVTIFLGIVLLKEKIRSLQALGILLCIIGIAILSIA